MCTDGPDPLSLTWDCDDGLLWLGAGSDQVVVRPGGTRGWGKSASGWRSLSVLLWGKTHLCLLLLFLSREL